MGNPGEVIPNPQLPAWLHSKEGLVNWEGAGVTWGGLRLGGIVGLSSRSGFRQPPSPWVGAGPVLTAGCLWSCVAGCPSPWYLALASTTLLGVRLLSLFLQQLLEGHEQGRRVPFYW